jgi:hypothetical protein
MSSTFRKRAAGLAAIIWGALSLYFWEFMRSALYDRILRAIEGIAQMIGASLTWDSALRLAVSLCFVALGVWLFWRSSPKRFQKLLAQGDSAAFAETAAELNRKVDVIAASLPPLEQRGSELRANLAELTRNYSGDVDRLNKIGVAQHGVNEGFRDQFKELQTTIKTLVDRFSTHERVVASGTRLLIRGICARDDRRFILIPNDKIAMSLGKRLVEAKVADYPDATSWLPDYQTWEAATRTIDKLMIDWTKEAPDMYTSLFKLERRHFANSPMPPDNIRSDDTIIPFKTVWHVQSSYANQRDGFFALLDERAVLPG